MIEIEAETTIDASPETVFEFLAVPKNHPKILSRLVEISEVEDADIGKQGRYVFKMIGRQWRDSSPTLSSTTRIVGHTS